MSISCEISWEKSASLLQQCKISSTLLFIESTLKKDTFIFLTGTVAEVSRASRSVTFTLDSGELRTFEFASAQSFTLFAGTSGRWELLVSLGGEDRVSFTTKRADVDEPPPSP